MDPANHSNSNSPTESRSQQDIFPLEGFEGCLDDISLPSLTDGLGDTLPPGDLEHLLTGYGQGAQINENTILDATDEENITIIAEPKASYRERYSSELDPMKNRAQRFIRTEEDNKKHEYPTIFVCLR